MDYRPQPSGMHSWNARTVQNTKTDQENVPQNKVKITKTYDHPNWYRKVIHQLRTDRNYLIIVKAINEKPTVNIWINAEKLEAFPQDNEEDKNVCFYPFFIHHSPGSPSQSNLTRIRNKRHSNQKDRSKIIFVCRWYDCVCRICSSTHKKLFELVSL